MPRPTRSFCGMGELLTIKMAEKSTARDAVGILNCIFSDFKVLKCV